MVVGANISVVALKIGKARAGTRDALAVTEGLTGRRFAVSGLRITARAGRTALDRCPLTQSSGAAVLRRAEPAIIAGIRIIGVGTCLIDAPIRRAKILVIAAAIDRTGARTHDALSAADPLAWRRLAVSSLGITARAARAAGPRSAGTDTAGTLVGIRAVISIDAGVGVIGMFAPLGDGVAAIVGTGIPVVALAGRRALTGAGRNTLIPTKFLTDRTNTDAVGGAAGQALGA